MTLNNWVTHPDYIFARTRQFVTRGSYLSLWFLASSSSIRVVRHYFVAIYDHRPKFQCIELFSINSHHTSFMKNRTGELSRTSKAIKPRNGEMTIKPVTVIK